MPVFPPGFSERVFEFSFNAEFSSRNRAVIAAAPHIPTQNEEKWLGYDVAFQINSRGGATHTLALQHKVSRFVDKVSGSNARFFYEAKGPYYAFRLDSDQYNLIQSISSLGLPGIEFYYCAPLFTTLGDMNGHYLPNQVTDHALWVDVSGGSQINDSSVHSIVYTERGDAAFRFSAEPTPLKVLRPRERERRPGDRRRLTRGEVKEMYETIWHGIHDYLPRRIRKVPTKIESESEEGTQRALPSEMLEPPKLLDNAEPFWPTARLLAKYLGVSWLVEVRE